jgi:hypothetical protein
VIFT